MLDRPGREWAFQAGGLELREHVPLQRIDDIYEVTTPNGSRVRFQANLDATADGFERQWPGSGPRYVRHVNAMAQIYRRLVPLQRISRPGLWDLTWSGGWRHLPFLLRSLDSVLARTRLPQPVRDALAIWTHIAGQQLKQAPSPLAFMPALFHGVGAFYPTGGIGRIPSSLSAAAQRNGVVFDYGVKVTAIRRREGRAAAAVDHLIQRHHAPSRTNAAHPRTVSQRSNVNTVQKRCVNGAFTLSPSLAHSLL